MEEYFESLGFVCPPKVNPPDFLLDVISGEISKAGFNPEKLADIWEEKSSGIDTLN